MAVIEITSHNQFTEATTTNAGDKISVIYFHTNWAEPCKAMSEVLKAISQDVNSNETQFLSIDADTNSEISELFNVSSVPYFVFIQNGTVLKELSSADPREFVKSLRQYVNINNDIFKQNTTTQNINDPDVDLSDDETEQELTERLTKLVTAAPVMLFMKGSPSEPKCGFSRQLVGMLREHQVRFGFFDILRDESVRQKLKKFSDWPTFPQLYIKGEFQGGLDIIKESLEEDPDFFQHSLQA